MSAVTPNAITQIAANGADNSGGFQPILQVQYITVDIYIGVRWRYNSEFMYLGA